MNDENGADFSWGATRIPTVWIDKYGLNCGCFWLLIKNKWSKVDGIMITFGITIWVIIKLGVKLITVSNIPLNYICLRFYCFKEYILDKQRQIY